MYWDWLFDASSFVTRNHCGPGWTPGLALTYKISNLIIAISFLEIPITLAVLYRKKRADLPTPSMLIMFITFIVLCGLTHLTDVLIFYWAPYRLYAVIYALAAVAAAVTAYKLPIVVRYLVKLPSRAYVHKINDQLQAEVLLRTRAEQELVTRNEQLRARMKAIEELLKANSLETLEGLLRTNKWIHERNAALQELNRMLSEWEAL